MPLACRPARGELAAPAIIPSCSSGKIGYASRPVARRTLRRMTASPSHEGRAPLGAYRCEVCGLWHIGHASGYNRRRRARRAGERG